MPPISEAQVVNDVSSNYHSPPSIAVGSSIQFRRSAVYLTAEYFADIDRYMVLDTSTFPESGLGSSLTNRITVELDPVLNVSGGYEYSPRDKLTVYASFLTDFSAAVDDPTAGNSVSTWDIFRVSGGASFTFASVDFTLGMSFGAGSDPYRRQNEVDVAIAEGAEIVYRRLKAFIGFEFTN